MSDRRLSTTRSTTRGSTRQTQIEPTKSDKKPSNNARRFSNQLERDTYRVSADFTEKILGKSQVIEKKEKDESA